MAILGLFGSLVVLQWLFLKYQEREAEKNLTNALEKGTSIPPLDEDPNHLRRPELESQLKKVLSPSKKDFVGNSFYFLITGEHGTGKTTAVLVVCNEVKKGILYVDVPDEVIKYDL